MSMNGEQRLSFDESFVDTLPDFSRAPPHITIKFCAKSAECPPKWIRSAEQKRTLALGRPLAGRSLPCFSRLFVYRVWKPLSACSDQALSFQPIYILPCFGPRSFFWRQRNRIRLPGWWVVARSRIRRHSFHSIRNLAVGLLSRFKEIYMRLEYLLPSSGHTTTCSFSPESF